MVDVVEYNLCTCAKFVYRLELGVTFLTSIWSSSILLERWVSKLLLNNDCLLFLISELFPLLIYSLFLCHVFTMSSMRFANVHYRVVAVKWSVKSSLIVFGFTLESIRTTLVSCINFPFHSFWHLFCRGNLWNMKLSESWYVISDRQGQSFFTSPMGKTWSLFSWILCLWSSVYICLTITLREKLYIHWDFLKRVHGLATDLNAEGCFPSNCERWCCIQYVVNIGFMIKIVLK